MMSLMKTGEPLGKRQIELLRDSFVAVLLDQERAGRLFYDRLFAIAPDVRAMFGQEMAAQRRILIQTLATIVTGLGDVATLRPMIAALGRRHVGYGVRPEHYAPVGEAIIHMVAGMGGAALEAETERAWRIGYGFVAGEMTAAGRMGQPAT